jgi:hypothetical protein
MGHTWRMLRTLLAFAALASGCASSPQSSNLTDAGSDSPSTVSDASAESATGPKVRADIQAACEQLWDAEISLGKRCGVPDRSVARAAELRARSATACVAKVMAPGNTQSVESLQACAALAPTLVCDEKLSEACEVRLGTRAPAESCGSNGQCASSTCVIPGAGGELCGACAPTVATGAACGSGIYCAPGNTCAKGVCTAVARSWTGGPCGSQFAVCAGRLECDATSKSCVALPRSEGDSCTGSRCFPNLVCSVESKCRAYAWVGVGESCDTTHQCEKGACSSGKCKAPTADGATCTSSSAPCDTFGSCLSGKCAIGDPSACL